MNERNCDDCVLWNCDNCVFATRSGGCRSWECEFIPIREAAAAWKAAQEWKEKDGKEE